MDAFGAEEYMEKIPVMIDSSVLKQIKKLNSPLMNQLIKYTRIGKFQLYFSVIIENEYLTCIKKEAQDAYDKIVSGSEALYQYYDEPTIMGFQLRLNMTANMAHNEINTILENITENWKKFKENTNAIILPIEEKHGQLVMNAYFKGNKPFKEVKYRQDIPDAFIYFSILEILKNNDHVVFISRDKEFVKHIQNDKIVIFESLKDLFESDEYCLKNEHFYSLSKTDKAFNMIQFFKDEILRKTERAIELSDLVYDLEQEVIYKAIGEYKNIATNAISVSLNYSNIKFITEYSYLVNFNAETVHSLTSIATDDELNEINSQRIEKLNDKEKNDNGSYEITELFTTNVSGNVSITFDHSDPLSLKEQEVDHFFKTKEIKEIEVVIEDIEKST